MDKYEGGSAIELGKEMQGRSSAKDDLVSMRLNELYIAEQDILEQFLPVHDGPEDIPEHILFVVDNDE